jgi:orotidine-5'-phosphate decarboxylase
MPSDANRIPAKDRLIFALDIAEPDDAVRLAERLRPEVTHFKVGLEAYLGGGSELVARIGGLGARVFLDLKLLDIPATVSKALRQIERRNDCVDLATIHVQHNPTPDLIRNAGLSRLKVLAVTALTSKDESDLRGEGVSESLAEYVVALAERALALGCHGVICSAKEARSLRERFGPGLLIVTPGIRPDWAEVKGDDQKRSATPREAIRAGADYLVVGRPIRDAQDPLEAARRIQEEIREALG